MTEYHVGHITLGNQVDITDPCYNKDVWCRMTTSCTPGEYDGYATVSDEGEWGKRVAKLSIYKGGKKCSLNKMSVIGIIGVDAGLAGFFNNKKDFSSEEWSEFCNSIWKPDSEKRRFWCMYDGIFSSSGYGDGEYKVFANANRTAFTIVFIPGRG